MWLNVYPILMFSLVKLRLVQNSMEKICLP